MSNVSSLNKGGASFKVTPCMDISHSLRTAWRLPLYFLEPGFLIVCTKMLRQIRTNKLGIFFFTSRSMQGLCTNKRQNVSQQKDLFRFDVTF